MIRGGGLLNAQVSGAVTLRDYAPLPFTTTVHIRHTGLDRNIWWGDQDAGFLRDDDTNAAACPGTAQAPAPTAGMLCVYTAETPSNVTTESGRLYGGSVDGLDGADNSGFYARVGASAAGSVALRYVWAYKAP